MDLANFGYNEEIQKLWEDLHLQDFEIGRIVAEHRERYIVRTKMGEKDAEITGNLRFSAKSRIDFPAVGDWVAFSVYDSSFSIIHQILPRYSLLSRKAVGQLGEIQIIASNVDFAFLVQSVDRDFNVNRLERYLTICYSSKVSPIIVITKTDLIDEERKDQIIQTIQQRINSVPIIAISNNTHLGLEELSHQIQKGKTYCMIGSSGVGKSTLMNNLSGNEIMRTEAISTSTNKGRHITTHRELILLENGGILIDNPGMREVGIADADLGLEITFNAILDYSQNCKFTDCSHTREEGCAVLQALESGEIDRHSYENYMKMQKEKEFFESSALERRQKDKEFGKMIKNYKKHFHK